LISKTLLAILFTLSIGLNVITLVALQYEHERVIRLTRTVNDLEAQLFPVLSPRSGLEVFPVIEDNGTTVYHVAKSKKLWEEGLAPTLYKSQDATQASQWALNYTSEAPP